MDERTPQGARRISGVVAIVACVLAALTACDTREQKPKTSAWSLVSDAAAQTTDLVAPHTAMSGAMQLVDAALALSSVTPYTAGTRN